jgi:threonine synthase
MPVDTPQVNVRESLLAGAAVFLVDGLITDCAKIVREGREASGWFDVSTLKEPYRIEGKKTMGLELAWQLGWNLPDVIVYPTGGGTGLIGMWKAFAELAALSWIDGSRLPRMVAVQSTGCDPIVRAFDAGMRFAEPFENASTIASGLRVPSAAGDFMILDAVRESHGTAVAVDESKIVDWMRLAAQCEGLALCPEAAACVGALEALAGRGWLRPDESVVIFNTGAAQKYVEILPCAAPRIEAGASLDWDRLAAAARDLRSPGLP